MVPGNRGTATAQMKGADVLALLDGRIYEMLDQIEQSSAWTAIMHGHGGEPFVMEVLKDLTHRQNLIDGMIAVVSCAPHISPANHLDGKRRCQECHRRKRAFRDCISLGLEDAHGRERSLGLGSVSSIWRKIAENRSPFADLGAIYLFETLAPIVGGLLRDHVELRFGHRQDLDVAGRDTATELEHARAIRRSVGDMLDLFPERAKSVIYGFERFARVYPVPVWTAAFRHAEQLFGQTIRHRANVSEEANLGLQE